MGSPPPLLQQGHSVSGSPFQQQQRPTSQPTLFQSTPTVPSQSVGPLNTYNQPQRDIRIIGPQTTPPTPRAIFADFQSVVATPPPIKTVSDQPVPGWEKALTAPVVAGYYNNETSGGGAAIANTPPPPQAAFKTAITYGSKPRSSSHAVNSAAPFSPVIPAAVPVNPAPAPVNSAPAPINPALVPVNPAPTPLTIFQSVPENIDEGAVFDLSRTAQFGTRLPNRLNDASTFPPAALKVAAVSSSHGSTTRTHPTPPSTVSLTGGSGEPGSNSRRRLHHQPRRGPHSSLQPENVLLPHHPPHHQLQQQQQQRETASVAQKTLSQPPQQITRWRGAAGRASYLSGGRVSAYTDPAQNEVDTGGSRQHHHQRLKHAHHNHQAARHRNSFKKHRIRNTVR